MLNLTCTVALVGVRKIKILYGSVIRFSQYKPNLNADNVGLLGGVKPQIGIMHVGEIMSRSLYDKLYRRFDTTLLDSEIRARIENLLRIERSLW